MDSVFVKSLFDSFRTMTDPLFERIKAVEKRFAELPAVEKGERGEPGKDADPVSVEELMAAFAKAVAVNGHGLRASLDEVLTKLVAEHIKALPVPKPVVVVGPEGPAGKDADVEVVTASVLAQTMPRGEIADLVASHVSEAVKAIPAPSSGAPGQDGRDGADGKDAEVDPEFIRAEIAKAVGEIPLPKDGADGAPGAPGGDGRDGVDGKDGVGLAGAMQSKDGTLVLTLTNGDIRDVGPVAGRDGHDGERGEKGMDGKDGAPGLNGTLEQLKIERLSERTVQFQFKDGTPVEGGTLRLNHPVFKDTWGLHPKYEKDDMVQWGGGGWIALVDDPPEKPGTGPPERTGWKQWIKSGSQGKTGAPGPIGHKGDQGPQGPQGRTGY